MREVVVMRWCDACQQEDMTKTPATSTFTIGAVAGESKPALKVLELCERHEKLITDLQLLLREVGQQPEMAPTATRAQHSYASSGAAEQVLCPVCQASVTRQALINHVWNRHRTEGRPEAPKVCPECRVSYPSPAGCGVHRRMAHGYDPLAEALAGVKGYRP